MHPLSLVTSFFVIIIKKARDKTVTEALKSKEGYQYNIVGSQANYRRWVYNRYCANQKDYREVF